MNPYEYKSCRNCWHSNIPEGKLYADNRVCYCMKYHEFVYMDDDACDMWDWDCVHGACTETWEEARARTYGREF